MKIQTVNYTQFEGKPREWRLNGLTLESANLIVGKNASGKTMALNVINGLARLLAGDTKLVYLSGDYDVIFEHEGKQLRYLLKYDDAKVSREEFTCDGKVYLSRGSGGVGKIFAEKMGADIDFQAPENELAAVVRRDSLQHNFFEPLYQWGRSLRHFEFGKALGKDVFAVLVKDMPADLDLKQTNQVVGIFRRAHREFKEAFTEAVKRDMARLGYEIDEIGTQPPVSFSVSMPLPGELVGLYVREKGLGGITDQNDMSQGMFRALSVIIQLDYAELSQSPSCILIDDVGEGLDFQRSCALIDLLMKKAERSSVQLIMTTNDRFVMNKVPLEAWSLLQRDGSTVHVFNYRTSKTRFDEFKFTGLNNFDFFATDFIHEEKSPT